MPSVPSQDEGPCRGQVYGPTFSQALYLVSKVPLGGNIAQPELDSNPALYLISM